MGSTRLRFVVGLAVGAASIPALGGVAEARRARIDPALFRNPLVLTSFVQNRRTDVHRNESLVFKFSAVVRRRSVDARSIRILESSTSGARQAVGALIPRLNTVRFDPTRTQRNYDESRRPNSTVVAGDNPTGFNSFSDFIVKIPGPPETHVLRNSQGAGILQPYSGQFSSSEEYFDPVVGQPYFVGISQSGNLGFDPPASSATGQVDEDALILFEFSEPIDINTLDPSSTVLVTRVAVNEPVPGFVRIDPADRSGRKFQFVPSLGFGSNLADQDGWVIQVVLTEGITDLAGNPLKRPYIAPLFKTRYVPGKKTASIISETFANQLRMDPVTLTDGGEWNTVEKGALRGGQPTTFPSKDVQYWLVPPAGVTVAFTRQNDPLVADTGSTSCFARPAGSRAQFLYIPSDVGPAAALVSVGWGPSSNALFGAGHPEVTIRFGHTSNTLLVSDFAANVNIGGLVQTFQGPYTIPQMKNIQPADGVDATGVTRDPPNGTPKGFWLYPIFTTPFEWNGVNNLVFDASCLPAPNCQIQRMGFVPAGIPFPARRAVGTQYTGTAADFTVDQVVADIRFNKRRRTTYATSLWYELSSDVPQFGIPVVAPSSQAGGVVVLVELEGADGRPDPLNPGGFIPNPTTATGFTTDVSKVDGHRFFRFRVTMSANLNSNQTVRLTSIQFPYVF